MKIARCINPCVAVLAALLASAAAAAPYRPANDADILEQLPLRSGSNADRMTRAMQTLLARDPGNLDVALRLAQIDVERARSESDPRQLGHAQATLAPWWDEASPPVPVLLLRATIRQSTHQFDPARADLQQIIAREPANAQAWLTLATVQQVTGDLADARSRCAQVSTLSAASIGTLCMASVDGVSGNAAKAYETVDALLARPAALGNAVHVQTWAATLQAELAERLGRALDAERAYRASLAIDPADAYTIAAYADFLLDAGRAADVVALIPLDTPVDGLLLRRAQADRALASAAATRSARDLTERFVALRERGDRVHLREEARFTLAILDAPQDALKLALENWSVQKEPLDARIAIECALAAGQPRAVDEIVRWIDRTQLQGARLSELVRQVRAP
ncbi:MAG TPA: tetratricopeptide repeat protein [Dokdonella sp.]